MLEEVIRKRAQEAWKTAWREPRWVYRHGSDGRMVPLMPCASRAVSAGATALDMGDDVRATIKGGKLHVDGNVHDLVRVLSLRPVDIEVAEGKSSLHLNVATFLREIDVAAGVPPSRVHIYIHANGVVDVAIAPTDAWVDPLIRCCVGDSSCIQQFIGKYNIGGVSPQVMERVFGLASYRQCPSGTPTELLPFCAPVRIMLDEKEAVDARYHHTVAELLHELPNRVIYLHGIPLHACRLALWALSPASHGVIHLYTKPARDRQLRTIMGGEVVLPKHYTTPAFVPCAHSFTGNAFAPALRYLPDELAKMAPKAPTKLFMQLLTQGEPMTIPRAQCIFQHMHVYFGAAPLAKVLVEMAMPVQQTAMQVLLGAEKAIPVHPTFARYVSHVTVSLA